MARGKKSKKKKQAVLDKEVLLTAEKLNEGPGNTIPGYCFTDEGVCDKIEPTVHTCIVWVDPVSKCRLPNPNYGCAFSPTLRLEKADKRFTISGRRSKRARSGKVRSETPGRTKGGNCVASPIQIYCATYSRGYKHPEYEAVMKSLHKRK